MEKVLLVNDCKFESFIMKDMLDNLGYEVNTTNEYGVFIKIERFKPDIIICNLIMKNINGDNLIKNIKIKNSKMICVLSSSNLIQLKDYKKNNVDEIIHTPIEKEDLETILKKITYKFNKTEKSDMHSQKFSFCPYCAGKLDNSKNFLFCPYCGKKL